MRARTIALLLFALCVFTLSLATASGAYTTTTTLTCTQTYTFDASIGIITSDVATIVFRDFGNTYTISSPVFISQHVKGWRRLMTAAEVWLWNGQIISGTFTFTHGERNVMSLFFYTFITTPTQITIIGYDGASHTKTFDVNVSYNSKWRFAFVRSFLVTVVPTFYQTGSLEIVSPKNALIMGGSAEINLTSVSFDNYTSVSIGAYDTVTFLLFNTFRVSVDGRRLSIYVLSESWTVDITLSTSVYNDSKASFLIIATDIYVISEETYTTTSVGTDNATTTMTLTTTIFSYYSATIDNNEQISAETNLTSTVIPIGAYVIVYFGDADRTAYTFYYPIYTDASGSTYYVIPTWLLIYNSYNTHVTLIFHTVYARVYYPAVSARVTNTISIYADYHNAVEQQVLIAGGAPTSIVIRNVSGATVTANTMFPLQTFLITVPNEILIYSFYFSNTVYVTTATAAYNLVFTVPQYWGSLEVNYVYVTTSDTFVHIYLTAGAFSTHTMTISVTGVAETNAIISATVTTYNTIVVIFTEVDLSSSYDTIIVTVIDEYPYTIVRSGTTQTAARLTFVTTISKYFSSTQLVNSDVARSLEKTPLLGPLLIFVVVVFASLVIIFTPISVALVVNAIIVGILVALGLIPRDAGLAITSAAMVFAFVSRFFEGD